MRIFDCFTFFNELDLLEIRLNILNEKIDYFVLVEATKTHSGQEKPLYYLENKDRFTNFNHKIIHVIVNDLPDINTHSRWDLENWQRNAIKRGLINKADDNDIIIISDLDEIPDLSTINWQKLLFPKKLYLYQFIFSYFKKIIYQQKYSSLLSKLGKRIINLLDKGDRRVVVFQQKLFYYYLNGFIEDTWLGSRAISYYHFKNYYKNSAQQLRDICYKNTIFPGGWHFSYLLSPEDIARKIKSFAHEEFDNKNYTEIELIKKKIALGDNLFYKDKKINYIELDESYPKYILDNRNKYQKYIKEIN